MNSVIRLTRTIMHTFPAESVMTVLRLLRGRERGWPRRGTRIFCAAGAGRSRRKGPPEMRCWRIFPILNRTGEPRRSSFAGYMRSLCPAIWLCRRNWKISEGSAGSLRGWLTCFRIH